MYISDVSVFLTTTIRAFVSLPAFQIDALWKHNWEGNWLGRKFCHNLCGCQNAISLTKQGWKLLTKELLKFAWVRSFIKKSITTPVCCFFIIFFFVVYVEWNISSLIMGSTGNIGKVSLLYEEAVTTGELRKFMCFADT